MSLLTVLFPPAPECLIGVYNCFSYNHFWCFIAFSCHLELSLLISCFCLKSLPQQKWGWIHAHVTKPNHRRADELITQSVWLWLAGDFAEGPQPHTPPCVPGNVWGIMPALPPSIINLPLSIIQVCSSHIFLWYDIILQWLNRRHVTMAIDGWMCLPDALGMQGCTQPHLSFYSYRRFFNYVFYGHMIITWVVMSSHANRCSHVHQTGIINTEGEIIILWLWGQGNVVWGQMKGNRCMMASGRTQKCHESQERRHWATGEDIPSPQQSLKNGQSWRKWHISPVFVGCFNQLSYVQDKTWICLEQGRVELAGQTPLNCLRVLRFGHVSTNRFITAMESVCLIHHRQSSSPLQCQLI